MCIILQSIAALFMLIIFRVGIRIVIVYALKVFRLHAEPDKGLFAQAEIPQSKVNLAHYVFHKARIVVSMFSHKFFVRTFEQRIQPAGRGVFYDGNHVFYPEKARIPQLYGNNAALVVRTVVADCLGTGAHRCDRHLH